jgi:2,5-diketo-D-gluconate reductase B
MKNIRLNENLSIPILGLGTWGLRGEAATEVVSQALEIGYRHFDTADMYGNHEEIGKAIAESKIAREELFITTKVPPQNLKRSTVLSSVNRFLDELSVDYIDLLLIHWPNPLINIYETLKALTDLEQRGQVKAIGVSNFSIGNLGRALNTGFEVSNNQIELHPWDFNKELVNYCKENKVSITAYSPLGRGADLGIAEVLDLADKYDATSAQIILAWLMSKNIVVIPRASNYEHLEENFISTKIKLTKSDLGIMDNIKKENPISHLAHFIFSFAAL